MSSGFEENDVCFINWEKLNKKGNNALKDSEHANFIELVRSAREQGLSFKVIVDESHQNNTIKSSDILGLFHTDKIIRCSATPRAVRDALLIEVPEEDVIAEGLIKKLLIINEGFEQHIRVEDQVSYLIDRALSRQSELRGEYLRRGVQVQPLIIVQLPNRSDALLESVERYFDSRGITYENGLLSVWLSDKKQNLEGIAEPDARPIAVIIKQAVATGWDCPRAQILVKLRDNMSEVFEIQTIGRIRRMPEARTTAASSWTAAISTPWMRNSPRASSSAWARTPWTPAGCCCARNTAPSPSSASTRPTSPSPATRGWLWR